MLEIPQEMQGTCWVELFITREGEGSFGVGTLIKDLCLRLISHPTQIGRQAATLITPEQGLILEVTP